MGRLSTVDLERNKALGSEMSFIIILEVSPRYSVEPCLDAPALTLDNNRIPFLPAEEFSPPQGKSCGSLSAVPGCELPGKEPPATSFVINSSGVGSLLVIVVFTLVSIDSPRLVSLLRAELTSRIAGAIDELELERQNKVAIDLFCAKEGVTSNIFPIANNSAVFDLVFAGSSSLSPTRQGLAVKE